MLLADAIEIVKNNLPNGRILKYVVYRELFVFLVIGDSPEEGMFDPYYSVNQKSGEFSEFSVFTDCEDFEILDLMAEAEEWR